MPTPYGALRMTASGSARYYRLLLALDCYQTASIDSPVLDSRQDEWFTRTMTAINGSGPDREMLTRGFTGVGAEQNDRHRIPRSPGTPTRPRGADQELPQVERPTEHAGVGDLSPRGTRAEWGPSSADRLASQLMPQRQIAPQAWWRRALRLAPEPAVIERDAAQQAMRRTFGTPVTIAVASPKGAAGKTPTTIGLCGAFGTARHGGVVAWDNNETRGTLLDRLEVTNRADVGELTRHADYFLSPHASTAGLERALNRQSDGEFMALGSDQHRGPSRIPADEVDLVHEILARFFSVIVIDCGNNEGAANHAAALRLADVLVVPIKWRRDSIHPALRMLDELSSAGYPLVGRTIVVASNKPGDVQREVEPTARAWFESELRLPVLDVPFDPVLDAEPIRWSLLEEKTRDAYRAIGSLISQNVLNNRPAG